MAKFVLLACVSVLVAVAAGQSFDQGLSIHQQQIQEHLRKEQDIHRLNGFQQPQPQQNNYGYQPQQNNYQQQPQQSYSSGQNAQVDYESGLRAHMQQIQAHLAKEASFQPQQNGVGDPAHQQQLQAHQRQIQEHLAKEQSHGYNAGAPVAPQAPQHHYQNQNAAPSGHSVPNLPGIDLHQRQIAEHKQREQQHQSLTGQAAQYHQSQQQYQPQQQNYNNNQFQYNNPFGKQF